MKSVVVVMMVLAFGSISWSQEQESKLLKLSKDLVVRVHGLGTVSKPNTKVVSVVVNNASKKRSYSVPREIAIKRMNEKVTEILFNLEHYPVTAKLSNIRKIVLVSYIYKRGWVSFIHSVIHAKLKHGNFEILKELNNSIYKQMWIDYPKDVSLALVK